jgi:hypothetical protein
MVILDVPVVARCVLYTCASMFNKSGFAMVIAPRVLRPAMIQIDSFSFNPWYYITGVKSKITYSPLSSSIFEIFYVLYRTVCFDKLSFKVTRCEHIFNYLPFTLLFCTDTNI